MTTTTRTRRFSIPVLFSAIAPLITDLRWVMLKSYTEYTLHTTRVDSLPCRSLVLKAGVCYLPAGIANEQQLADLKESGIGPDEVVFIEGGFLDTVLDDPERKVIKKIARELRNGSYLRLFHPIARTLEELRLPHQEHSKHNAVLIEELKKELGGWSDHQIWQRMLLNNNITAGSSHDDQSKIAQYQALGELGKAYFPPFEVSEVSVVALTQAKEKVEEAFFQQYGFHLPARVKMDGKASGDGQWSLRDYTVAQVVDAIDYLSKPHRPRWMPLVAKVARSLPVLSRVAKNRVVAREKVLVVPCIAQAMVDISVNALILDREVAGVKPGVYIISSTLQLFRMTPDGKKEWCGNMEVTPGMLLHAADRGGDVSPLIATEGFMQDLFSFAATFLTEMRKNKPITGLLSLDLGYFWNPVARQWSRFPHEINPRPTNGTHLCEFLWQVDQRVAPEMVTGALVVLKINKEDGLTYQQQLETLGEDFLPNDYSRHCGAKPIVADSAKTEGQMVYAFAAPTPQELRGLIDRVWRKLKCLGTCDAVLLLNE